MVKQQQDIAINKQYLEQNGYSLEGYVGWPSFFLMAIIASHIEYCYLPFCSKYCD